MVCAHMRDMNPLSMWLRCEEVMSCAGWGSVNLFGGQGSRGIRHLDEVGTYGVEHIIVY